MTDDLSEIKQNIKTGKLVLGLEKTTKLLQQGKLAKVYVASNLPDSTFEDLDHYTKLAEVELARLDTPNDELGIVCKKPFSISVIGLLK